MTTDDKSTAKDRKSVGVYDRPASADRRKYVLWAIMFLMAAAGAFGSYWLWSR